ncbi:hypothetical protein HRbin11_01349 [bacterium HR11]|nr:hypothetical protein HRbin11_01349 [bacterium HR11]
MARLVRHDRKRPYVLKPEDVQQWPIYLCACGLSKNKPFCDGSHKRTRDEEPGELYVYDDEGRIRVQTFYSEE